MSFRARFNRFSAGVLVLLWLVGVVLLATMYATGANTGWGLLVAVLNAPLIWKLLLHAVGEGSQP